MIRFIALFQAILYSFVGIAGNKDNSGFDVLHYEIRLDVLDFSTRVIHGNTTVTFLTTATPFTMLELQLRQLGVDSVYFQGQPIGSYSHTGDFLNITLPQSLSSGDTSAVTIFYHGVPYSESWGGFHFIGQYAFTLGVGFTTYPPNLGKAWFPCKDDFFDRALFDCFIRVATNMQATSGGLLQSVTPHGDGTHTYHWKMDYTIPTYLASVAVGDYVAVTDTFNGMERDIPITIYVRPADVGKVAGSFVNLETIMSNLENRFGPYPFERIGYTGTALGAMEHAGNVAYPNVCIDNTTNFEWLYVHEISHMWFGNKVTCAGPGDMWLNEGWAVWTELLFREDLYGPETALVTQRSKHRNALQYLHTPQGDGAYLALYNVPPANVYGETVYQKGGLVVHTLRNYMGDELFFPAIQFYLDTLAYHHASSYDLRDMLSLSSGINLTGFFDSWVFQPGFPHYSIDSAIVSGNSAEVFVRQRSKGREFLGDDNIVEITFMNNGFQLYSDTMMFDGPSGTKTFDLPFEPALAMMDYYEKICDATTDRAQFIVSTGTKEFADTFSRLIVSNAGDSAFVRITHNWVPPDPLKDPKPGLTLSPYRHWHVDGIIPAGFDSEIHFFYQRTGFLDNNLIINPADSIVILYRPSPAEDWQGIPFTRFGPWSVGWIMVDTLRLGEYTLGIWDSMYVGKTEIAQQEHKKLSCYPNPASGFVYLGWSYKDSGKIIVTDLSGKPVLEIQAQKPEGNFRWDTGNVKPGVYFITLLSSGNNIVASEKVLIR